MPLVVPGVTSGDAENSKTQQWMNALMGKSIGEKDDANTFDKSKLPEKHRIIKPGQMVTKDFDQDRLNVHVGEDGNVTHVDHQ